MIRVHFSSMHENFTQGSRFCPDIFRKKKQKQKKSGEKKLFKNSIDKKNNTKNENEKTKIPVKQRIFTRVKVLDSYYSHFFSIHLLINKLAIINENKKKCHKIRFVPLSKVIVM